MTDQNTALTTIESALADLRDGNQTVAQISEQLFGLWQYAADTGDTAAVERYQATWGLLNDLATSNDTARQIIQAVGAERDHAIAERDEVTTQRDQVTESFTGYQNAVINMDMQHPEAGRHIRLVHRKGMLDGRDEGWDEGYEEGAADALDGDLFMIMSNDPSEDMLNGIFYDFRQDAETDALCQKAEDFAVMLFGDETVVDIYSAELRQKVAAFILEINPQIVAERTAYEAREDAERRERETRWAAERAARQARAAVPMTDHLTEDGDDYDEDENSDPDA